jgi:ZIP family zinc transporter
MNNQSMLILSYLLITMGAGLVGGLLALFWSPNVKWRSAVQHFAAGAVLAAVASNVIPEVERTGTITGIIGGFVAGGLVMIGLKWAVLKLEKAEKSKQRLPFGLAAAAGVDTLIDGAITRAGFFTGQQLGVLLAIALSIELFFLTLSVGSEFRKGKSRGWLGIAVTIGITILFGIGALGADIFLEGSPETTIAVILAFGAAALIYLIAEELLVEAIQAEESLFSTAMLFAGFFILIAIKIFNAGNPI